MDADRADLATMDLPTLQRFGEVALAALAEAREEIDALNVYPVPDGDTGTNMFLTFEAALEAQGSAEPPGDLRASLAAFARGALLGARGSSGVILAQLVGAICRRLAEAGPADRTAEVFARALVEAADASYAAVGEPVEGTILSVARASARAAEQSAAEPRHRLGHVVRAAASAARDALERTPDQMRLLREAGVVDAGGRGLCVILDAAETAVTGNRPLRARGLGRHTIPVPVPAGDLTEHGPAYEVMYLLDADAEAVVPLRRRLAALGDSLVVVGGERLWNVHVHVDDVGAAIEAGIEAGRPHRVRVTHFAEQVASRQPTPRSAGHEGGVDGRPGGGARRGRRVVVVAQGRGLAGLFAEAGAVVVSGEGRRPSTGELTEAIAGSAAAEVVILPNDEASLPAAEAAAGTARHELGVRAAVVPSSAQVQGLAAMAVHEPGRRFDQDVLEMTAAARHARSGAVTVAASRAMTSGGPCEPGDVLGAVEGDFVVVGSDLDGVAVEVLERLLGGGGELVTLLAGRDGEELAGRCADHVRRTRPTVDVVTYEGGQDDYPLLLGVE